MEGYNQFSKLKSKHSYYFLGFALHQKMPADFVDKPLINFDQSETKRKLVAGILVRVDHLQQALLLSPAHTKTIS